MPDVIPGHYEEIEAESRLHVFALTAGVNVLLEDLSEHRTGTSTPNEFGDFVIDGLLKPIGFTPKNKMSLETWEESGEEATHPFVCVVVDFIRLERARQLDIDIEPIDKEHYIHLVRRGVDGVGRVLGETIKHQTEGVAILGSIASSNDAWRVISKAIMSSDQIEYDPEQGQVHEQVSVPTVVGITASRILDFIYHSYPVSELTEPLLGDPPS